MVDNGILLLIFSSLIAILFFELYVDKRLNSRPADRTIVILHSNDLTAPLA